MPRQVSSAPMAKHQCGNPKGSHAGIEQAERSVCCANANKITRYRCLSGLFLRKKNAKKKLHNKNSRK